MIYEVDENDEDDEVLGVEDGEDEDPRQWGDQMSGNAMPSQPWYNVFSLGCLGELTPSTVL